MSRPQKAIVDYFPHFCNHGKTMFTIEAKFGNDGYAFWFKLLELLGQSEQHYIDCSDTATWEFLLAKTRLNGVSANNILDLLAKLGAINPELWKYKIIRSDKFIENLQILYSRRKVKILNNDELLNKCMQKPDSTGLLYAETQLNGVNACKNPQSKVKKSKVKKSKVKYILSTENKIKFADFVYLKYSEVKRLLKEFGREQVAWMILELDCYITNNKRGREYIDHNKVIRGWVLEKYEKRFAKEPQPKVLPYSIDEI